MDAPFVYVDGHWVSTESGMGKELAKWNKPYEFKQFPLMLYRAQRLPGSGKWVTSDPTNEAFTLSCQRVVRSEAELEAAKREGVGWSDSPQSAIEWALGLEKEISNAAAERAYQDRNMSEKAKAESASAEGENFGHLPEIPEKPVARRGRPPKTQSAA